LSSLVVADLNGYALLALAAHWLGLWLGMYLVGRRPRSAAAVLTGLAFIAAATYLLEAAYYYIPTTVEGVAQRERWLAGWCIFAPPLLFHAFLLLTSARARWYRGLLVFCYAMATVVFVGGFFNGVFNDFEAVQLDAQGYAGSLPPGRFYWVMAVEMVLPVGLAVAVLIQARLARPTPPEAIRGQLNMLILGTVLFLLGAMAVAINCGTAVPIPESLLFPMGAAGGLIMAVPLVRYSGRLGGQLLRSDAMTSMLTAVLMLAAFLTTAVLLGASINVVAGIGWLILVPVTLGGDLRALADRAFYGRAARAARAGLRTAEAYAGSPQVVDLDAIAPGQSTEVIGYLSDLDRAGLASGGANSLDGDWLKLLARDEFVGVRDALGLSPDWSLANGRLPLEEMRRRAGLKLEPRERQALGLWYLGHSDKDMARLMGVKPNVPRSYLTQGKKKLGLTAGPSLTLFVHLSGFVGADALPLLQSGLPDS
jgi:DNA-binding CsgD family transcriptional regulator